MFQVKSSLLHEYVKLRMGEVVRRMLPPECMPLSKLSSYLHVTQQFYQFFSNLQPNIEEVVDLKDIDLYLKKKDKKRKLTSESVSFITIV